MNKPWEKDPTVEKHGPIWVVRDDLLPGGSKTRFLAQLIAGAREVVYGSSCQGGAGPALAVVGKHLGIKVSLFYAKRKQLLPRQLTAKNNGALIHEVPMGYLSHVQSAAQGYAQKAGAHFLPLGFDAPAAEDPFVEVMQRVRKKIGDPDEVWCACATGMMTRCLGKAFPNSRVVGVTVGAESRHGKQNFSSNVILVPSRFKDLSQPCKVSAPFPICPNYEAKPWEVLIEAQRKRGNFSALFWNVIGLQ